MKPREKTRSDYLRELLDKFIAEHGNHPVDLGDMYRWAKRNRLWEPPERDLVRQFKDEMARAAREDYYTDPQGREVRRKHAIVIKEGETQRSLWADIQSAPPDHMRLALQQRRRGIFGDVKQLKTDMDSYNENNNPGPSIQMSFNFDEDLRETAEDTTYPEAPPEDDEDDDGEA